MTLLFLFLWLEDNIVCNLLFLVHFQMVKRKVCLLLENLAQLRSLNIDLFFLLILLFDIYTN